MELLNKLKNNIQDSWSFTLTRGEPKFLCRITNVVKGSGINENKIFLDGTFLQGPFLLLHHSKWAVHRTKTQPSRI